jgi:uncharacterized protein (DUF58 family)
MLVLLAWLVILGLSTGFPLFYRLGYIISIGLFISYIWNYLNLWQVTVTAERRTGIAYTGQSFDIRIWATNAGFFSKSRIDIRDLSTLTGNSHVTPIALGSRQTRSWLLNTTCPHRGAYTLGPLEVHSEDLFGFFYKTKIQGTQQNIVVYPKIIELPSINSPLPHFFDEGTKSKKTQVPTPQATSIRKYEFGDTVNRIHWPMTAKHGELMSKEFDVSFSTESWIVLDLQSTAHRNHGSHSTDETAVTVAVSLAKRLMHLGTSVGILSQNSTAIEIPLGRGQQHLIRMLDILAHSQADGHAPVETILTNNQHKFGEHCILTIITTALSSSLWKVLPRLQRTGIAISVVQVEVDPIHTKPTEPFFQNTIPTVYINPESNLDISLKPLYMPLAPNSLRNNHPVPDNLE